MTHRVSLVYTVQKLPVLICCTILRSSDERGELSLWLLRDDNTMHVVLIIIVVLLLYFTHGLLVCWLLFQTKKRWHSLRKRSDRSARRTSDCSASYRWRLNDVNSSVVICPRVNQVWKWTTNGLCATRQLSVYILFLICTAKSRVTWQRSFRKIETVEMLAVGWRDVWVY